MQWLLVIEEFGTNIQHIYGVENIVADTLSILTSTHVDKYERITVKSQCCVNESFTIGSYKNNKYCFPLNLLIFKDNNKRS